MAMFFDIIGMLGVALILCAYTLLQLDKISTKYLSYHILNLVGALLIIVSLFAAWNLPAFMMETAWVCISIYGFIHCLKQRRKTG